MFFPAFADLTTTQDITVEQPMINEGSTALPYEPYFEGLRSAPVTEVESVGKNLWNNAAALLSSDRWTRTETGLKYVRGSHTGGDYAYYVIPLEKGQTVTFSCDGSSYKPHLFLYKERAYGTNLVSTTAGSLTYTAQEDLPNATFTVIINTNNGDNEVSNIQVEYGDSATPYSPFAEPITLPIPTEVQSLDGYGGGVSESVYNYIDFEKKQFVKRVGKVDMGMLGWTRGSSVFYAYVGSKKTGNSNMLCSTYPTSNDWWSDTPDKTLSGNDVEPYIYIKDSNYTDATVFKSAMSGVMFYYELAEPIITDISDILSEDNFIGVEGNGTVTLKNEYSYDVPSEITYQIKEVTV